MEPDAGKRSHGGDPAGPRRKKAREVAEMTLALAAMVEMRGEREPTETEREMMEKARGKLAEVCLGFSPREVFPVGAFGAVMADLGLGLGFRPTAKLSIGEKVVYAKQKFEKAEANAKRSAMQAESHGAAHTTNMFPSDKSKSVPVSSGVLHSVLPTAANSTSVPYQLPASEVKKPIVSSGLPNSTSLSRVERPPHRLDHRPNGSTYTPQLQAKFPVSHAQPAWSQHTQPSSLAKTGPHNKVLPHNIKLQGNSKGESVTAPTVNVHMQRTTKPAMNQHLQRTNVQTSLPNNTHSEICKVINKFLQSHLPKRAVWNPPSRDYMNKSVTCQVCKVAIVEVENVLVCDACENGYHTKCLHSQDLKTIPRGEWHCFKCLAITDGKPLPPKYGRVTRNVTAPKAALPPFSEKKADKSNDQANRQKLMTNGVRSLPANNMVNTNNSSSDSNAPNTRAMHTSLSTTKKCHVEKPGAESKAKTPLGSSEAVEKLLNCVPSCNGQDNDMKISPSSEGIPSKQCNENHLANKNSGTFDTSKSRVDVKQEEKGVAHLEAVQNSENIVDWIGDVAQVADEKTFYSSCCINGSVYCVNDHALFTCDKKSVPSKIQTMWEDNKTRLKWLLVNRCYFPGDLPEAVGHPCSLEANEVYESNHGCTVLANLIQGPCDVLPPEKHIQESERRSRLGSKEIGGLRPLFQCKWFYDELKGSFRDFSSLSQADMVLDK